jgi:alpha-tubulin suppressor-like RCC1 family protein
MNDLKVDELRSMAKSMSIKGYSKLKKSDLINTIVSSPQYQRTRSPQKTRAPQRTQFTDLVFDTLSVICNQSSIKDLRNIKDSNREIREACTPILEEKINKLQISAGGNHSLALDEYGNVWSCGDNGYGQLGLGGGATRTNKVSLGDNKNRNKFTKTKLNNIQQISAGKYHSLALDNQGNVWSCGNNDYGQLGLGGGATRTNSVSLGDDKNRNVFTKTNMKNVVAISAGSLHSLALDKSGNVWSCGDNEEGQLGLGNNTKTNVFTKTNINNVVAISTGSYYSLALDSNGNIWSCGWNKDGQLGLGGKKNRNLFTQTNMNNIIQISAGDAYSLALDNSGNVWSCGLNEYGQLGLRDYNDRDLFTRTNLGNIKQISAGYNYSLALDDKGYVWGCGLNYYGQLGLGDNIIKNIFTKTKLNNVIKISAGGNHSLSLNNDGNVLSCGFNRVGQLGLGGGATRTNSVSLGNKKNKDVFTKTNIF